MPEPELAVSDRPKIPPPYDPRALHTKWIEMIRTNQGSSRKDRERLLTRDQARMHPIVYDILMATSSIKTTDTYIQLPSNIVRMMDDFIMNTNGWTAGEEDMKAQFFAYFEAISADLLERQTKRGYMVGEIFGFLEFFMVHRYESVV